MKISCMLKREDFYQINENTLKQFYKNSKQEKDLYIYPELNAIVTARPSKTVRQYLYTEFRISGSLLKRLLVRCYAGVLLNSRGLLATRRLRIKTDADNDTLIYPCNKKYRVFDFENNQVSVFAKEGFPTTGLDKEIAFRSKTTANFIPGLLHAWSTGYTETIIDGCPVVRTGQKMQTLSDRAFGIWSSYILPHTRQVPPAEYAQMLSEQIDRLKEQIQKIGKTLDFSMLDAVCGERLGQMQLGQEPVPVSLSHGDLQPGNIWVENGTDRLYIIDWESWERRSIWYDRATLYEGLRTADGIALYAANRDPIHATVLLEDVIFRLAELTALPCDYGSREFHTYLQVLHGGQGVV